MTEVVTARADLRARLGALPLSVGPRRPCAVVMTMGALHVGHLTLMQHARKAYDGTIIAMVRPREGDFHYSNAEIRLMLQEAETLLQAGADGIAVISAVLNAPDVTKAVHDLLAQMT